MPMNQVFVHAEDRRYRNVDVEKARGVTYTPPALARFVAERMIENADLEGRDALAVLDPAIGDGALVLALLDALRGKPARGCASAPSTPIPSRSTVRRAASASAIRTWNSTSRTAISSISRCSPTTRTLRHCSGSVRSSLSIWSSPTRRMSARRFSARIGRNGLRGRSGWKGA
jgi:hypothetical protein